MKTFISPTASKLLVQVTDTMIQQEEILNEQDKKHYPFHMSILNACVQSYGANKVDILSLALVRKSSGYSLSINEEVVSFLEVI